jgi:hypothetical protein
MKEMTNEQQEHMNRAKAWCFDNGVTEAQIQAAWNKSLETNAIIQNLNKHGNSWWWLPPHLLQQLFDRYLPQATEPAQAVKNL